MRIFRLLIAVYFVVIANVSANAADIFDVKVRNSDTETMVIYSSLDVNFVGDLVLGFQKLQPNVIVEYHDLQSFDIYEKIVSESDSKGETVDFVFSSAMDLQFKLANDGYAQKVVDAELNKLPSYTQWRQMVFGLTYEPAVIVYNKQWFKQKEIPTTHDEFTKLIIKYSPELYNKVATYDIERSGLGLFFMAQDQENNKNIWSLVDAMGSAGVRLYSSSSAILQRVADGRFALGYNILGSYAKSYAKTNPDLGIIMPEDYTIIMSRIGLVPKFARQPELGRAFLKFLASQQGQALLQEKTNMLSLDDTRNSAKFKHVRIGAGLLVYQDQLKRQRLIRKWNAMLKNN